MKPLKKRSARPLKFTFKVSRDYAQADLRFIVSKITGNLHFAGMFDGCEVIGFVNRGGKRKQLGASVVECDALRRGDHDAFLLKVACLARWHGFIPSMLKGVK